MIENKYDLFEMYDNFVRSQAEKRNLKDCSTKCFKGEYIVTIPSIHLKYSIDIEYLLLNLKADYETEKSNIIFYISRYYSRNKAKIA